MLIYFVNSSFANVTTITNYYFTIHTLTVSVFTQFLNLCGPYCADLTSPVSCYDSRLIRPAWMLWLYVPMLFICLFLVKAIAELIMHVKGCFYLVAFNLRN